MIVLAAAANAQIVQSGFETWSGSLPDGWGGSSTNIDAANVTQVTSNVHSGTYALRLANPTTPHKRFSTQPVTVAQYDVYEVTFWLRGAGQVRTGIYDASTVDFGYHYGDYVTATSDWTQVTQYLLSWNSTSNAQFILSVLSTSGEHIVVDDVTITQSYSLASPLPIHEIQFTSTSDGASPYADRPVRFNGIVTAVDHFDNNDEPILTYYVQDVSGPWNGIIVVDFDDSGHDVEIGDQIDLVGTATEYFGLTEIYGADIDSLRIVATGQPLPEPLVIPTSDLPYEALESVLVRVENATCTDPPSGANFGNWSVDDGSGAALIGHQLYEVAPDPTLGTAYNVTGVVSFGFDEYHIEPRMASDVEAANGIAEEGVLATVTVGPNPATDAVTIALGQAAGRRVDYTLTDLQGRILHTGLLTSDRTAVGLEGLASGTYHLTLRSAELLKTVAVQVVR